MISEWIMLEEEHGIMVPIIDCNLRNDTVWKFTIYGWIIFTSMLKEESGEPG